MSSLDTVTAVDLGLPGVPPRAADRPDDPRLIDSFGRVATDLRVSVTDHCNLRCTYCMPADGLDWLPKDSVLTDGELIRLLRVAVTMLGVANVRFTGGEPLLRRGLIDIIAATSALRPRPRIAMTSNGIGLTARATSLADAGLDRINVSLDTLREPTFRTLTRRDRLADVLDGLAAATAAGIRPVKVNTVLLRGINDGEAVDLLRYCLARGYQLRFIEQMPLDPQHGWSRAEMVTADEILDALRAEVELTPSGRPRGSAPAEEWAVRDQATGLTGTVGVIASVTRPFCGDCDRSRLTADGQMRTCLFATEELDLRALLRDGADDEHIAHAWRAAMWGKLAGHEIDSAGFVQPIRPMSAIGG